MKKNIWKGPEAAQGRAALLLAYDRSGLSAAAFARQQGVNYQTFCGWRRRRDKAGAPAFVEVELPAASAPAELVIELGGASRMRLNSSAQVELAACLLQKLQALPPC